MCRRPRTGGVTMFDLLRSSSMPRLRAPHRMSRLALWPVLAILLSPSLHGQAVAASVTAGAAPVAVAVDTATNNIFVANSGASSVTAVKGTTNAATTIAVGASPSAVAVNTATHRVYVANHGSGSVSVIDESTSKVVATITVGVSPAALAVNETTNQIYVANSGDGSVSVIDGTSGAVKTITVGSAPMAIAVNPVTNRTYVANSAGNSLSVIDGASATVAATVPVGATPSALSINVITNQVYVANRGDNTVTVMDGSSQATASVTVGASPSAIAVNPVTNLVYVANTGASTATVIDGASHAATATVNVGSGPAAIAVNSLTNQIFVSNGSAKTVTVINGGSNTTATLTVGTAPLGIAVNPVTNFIYVANKTTGTVSVITGAMNALSTITAGTMPTLVAQNPVTGTVYVANINTNSLTPPAPGTITIANGATKTTSSLTGGTGPWIIAVNPATNRIYVGNKGGGITVIDGLTNTILATVSAGSNPWAIAVNTVTNMVYVANYGSNTMTVINGATNTVAATVIVGTKPVAVAVDPLTNKIYTANSGSANVTIVDGVTNTVTATLTVGTTPWALAVNQQTSEVYVANEAAKSVSVINEAAGAVSTTISVGTAPWALALSPSANTVYVANYSSSSVSVIDGASKKVTATVAVGTNPASLAVHPVTNQIYVGNKGSGNVSVIDGNSNAVTATLATGSSTSAPNSLIVDPVTNYVWVANSVGTTVSVIDTTATQAKVTVPVTIPATGPADDPLMVSPASTTQGTPYITRNTKPTFTATVTPAYPTSTAYTNDPAHNPANPPVMTLYYRVDDGAGAWTPVAANASAGFPATFPLPLDTPSAGLHTIFLYAAYGTQGSPSGSGAGSGNSPEVSNVAAIPFVVYPPSTTMKLTADVNPQDVGFNVTVAASVTPISTPPDGSVPSGSVSFFDTFSGKTTLLGSGAIGTVNGSNVAQFQTSFAAAGSHTITAIYLGDPKFSGSTAILKETITAPGATQAIAAITMTKGQSFGSIIPVTGSAGIAPLTYSVSPALPAGLSYSSSTGAISGAPTAGSAATTYAVTVTDVNNLTDIATFALDVVQASGTATPTLTVSASTNAITDKQGVDVTLKVSGSGATPTGVATLVGDHYFNQLPLVSGSTSFTVPASALIAGPNTLTAYYPGDSAYAAGSAKTLVTEFPVVMAIPPMPDIASGSTASVDATLTAGSTYTGTINLACVLISAPQAAQVLPTCTLNLPSVAFTKTATTGKSTITINASKPSLQSRLSSMGGKTAWTFAGSSALAGVMLFFVPGKRRRATWLAMLCLTAVLTGITGCGSTSVYPYLPSTGSATPGTYTFSVMGVDSTRAALTTNMTTVTVTIQ